MRMPGTGLAPYLSLAFSLLAAGSLIACADDGITPEPPVLARQNIPPDFTVRAKVAHHPLLVTPATGAISPAERQGLTGFLANFAGGNSQALHVRVTGLLTPEAKESLTRVLVAEGVEPSKIEFAAGAAAPGTRRVYQLATDVTGARAADGPIDVAMVYGRSVKVDVAAEIYSVVPPICPRISRVRIVGNDNGVASNWSCASVSVFEQMVADPRDLVRGESGGTTDSEVTSGAVDRMRKDKQKTLQDTGSVTTGGGGG